MTMYERITDIMAFIYDCIRNSKASVWLISMVAWIASTYIHLFPAIGFFLICTTLDTASRIDVNARLKKIRFRPWKKEFWFEIDPDMLRVWFDKVFKQYIVYVLIAYLFDVIILKSELKFNVYILKLDIPTALVLFFSFLEIFSAFRHQEELGRKNYIKIIINIFSSFIPENIKDALSRTIEETDKKQVVKKRLKTNQYDKKK